MADKWAGEIRVNVVEGDKSRNDALRRTMMQMKDTAQRDFANPLNVRQGDPEDNPDGYRGPNADFFLEEVLVKGNLLKARKTNELVQVNTGWWGGDEERGVFCRVYDKKLQDIVERQITEYARSIGANSVEIVKEYPEE